MSIHTPITPATSTTLPPHIVGGIPSSSIDWENTKPTPPEAPAIIQTSNAVVDRHHLTQAIAVAKSTVQKRVADPILTNALLRESNGDLQITTTNLDCEITVTIEASIDAGFDTTVPCHKMHELLAKSRKSEMTALTTDHKWKGMEIDTENARFNLKNLPSDEFPIMNFDDQTNSFSIDGSVFWDLLNNVKGAMSTEETRYYLNGVYLHEHDGKLVAVATDGHRLYYQETTLPAGADNMPGIIIPRAVIANFLALTKTDKNRPESVEIAMSESRIDFCFDNVRIRSKLVDGTYPDYHRVIPAYNDKHAHFDAGDMIGAIKDVALISSDKGRAVELKINGDALILSVNNPESGTASASITGLPGNAEMAIGYNSKYILDILAQISGNVTLELQDTDSPTLITGNIEGWKAVLMPMRL